MSFKVVLTFNLTEGSADEELRRSLEATSFPSLLAKQPGCREIDLIRIGDDKTMSIQTWETEKDWWAALEHVKAETATLIEDERESILMSRDFVGGEVVRTVRSGSD